MAEIELKSCPMCGGKNVETRYVYCRPYIICDKCHFRTPCYNVYEQALEAWNRRADNDR